VKPPKPPWGSAEISAFVSARSLAFCALGAQMKILRWQDESLIPIAICIVMGSSISCVAQNLLSARAESIEARRQRHEETVLEYLRDVAWSSRKAIRLYYQAKCAPMKGSLVDYSVPMPQFRVQPPSRGKSGLAAVRDIFNHAKGVRIAEKPEGIIRIWLGEVPTEILRTKIHRLILDRQAQYDPSFAIAAIESTKEMNAAMNSLRLTLSPDVGGSVAPVWKGLPHLPASVNDVTVDQALDMIAKTWGGPVVYGACTARTGGSGTKLVAIWNAGAVLGQTF
jgi:hypothetical protein